MGKLYLNFWGNQPTLPSNLKNPAVFLSLSVWKIQRSFYFVKETHDGHKRNKTEPKYCVRYPKYFPNLFSSLAFLQIFSQATISTRDYILNVYYPIQSKSTLVFPKIWLLSGGLINPA